MKNSASLNYKVVTEFYTVVTIVDIRLVNISTRKLFLYYLLREKGDYPSYVLNYFEGLNHLFNFFYAIEDFYELKDSTDIPADDQPEINGTFAKEFKSFLETNQVFRIKRALLFLLIYYLTHQEGLEEGLQEYFEDLRMFMDFLDTIESKGVTASID